MHLCLNSLNSFCKKTPNTAFLSFFETVSYNQAPWFQKHRNLVLDAFLSITEREGVFLSTLNTNTNGANYLDRKTKNRNRTN